MSSLLARNLGERRVVTDADGGSSVGTSRSFHQLIPGTKVVGMTIRDLQTANALRYLFNPFLVVLRSQDALVTATDFSEAAQNNDETDVIVLDDQDTLANDESLMVGAMVPFGGVDVNVVKPNGTASILTVKYWDGDSWEDISDVDGTIDTGKTLAIDGEITWTVPSDWQPGPLTEINGAAAVRHATDRRMYWTRWEVSVKLDAEVELGHLLAINRSTLYDEFVEGYNIEEYLWGKNGFGCIETIVDAGSAKLILAAYAGEGQTFP